MVKVGSGPLQGDAITVSSVLGEVRLVHRARLRGKSADFILKSILRLFIGLLKP